MSEETRETDVLDARQMLRPDHIPAQPRLVARRKAPRYLRSACRGLITDRAGPLSSTEKPISLIPRIHEKAVSALAESIIRDRCAGADAEPAETYKSVSTFLLRTQAGMPDYLRLPLKGMTLAFSLWAVPTAGRLFHLLPPERRSRQVRAWKESSLGPRRDLIKFYETLTVFGWYSALYGRDYTHGTESIGKT